MDLYTKAKEEGTLHLMRKTIKEEEESANAVDDSSMRTHIIFELTVGKRDGEDKTVYIAKLKAMSNEYLLSEYYCDKRGDEYDDM